MDLRDKDVLVVGTKRSGLGAIGLLKKQGARVRAMDAELLPAAERAKFDEMNVPVALQTAGNIAMNGRAVTSLVETSDEEQWNVLELSSFQLESISHFEARIAACLNVTPDHLDRHGSFENYKAAKARLFETQSSFDQAVLNYDDAVCREYAGETKGELFWFSSSQSVPQGVAMEGGALLYCGEKFAERSQIKLRGLHNVENVMAAALMAHLAGADLDELGAAIETFPGVEHRIEFVRELEGVEYYNDSKATNVDAALKAIAAFDGSLWIILGGKDKGSDYRPLREPLAQRAKGVLLIGAPPPYPYAADRARACGCAAFERLRNSGRSPALCTAARGAG